jgi:deoxyribonucleoside regulator
MISKKLLFEVAVAYYIKKKLQREIAEEYGVSRVQVSKYLKLAEQRGIVQITINPPWVSATNLEKFQTLFKEIFGLKHLVLTPGNSNSDKAHPMLIEYAGKWIDEHISNDSITVGVGWGRTMYDLSEFRGANVRKDMWTYLPLTLPLSDRRELYFDYTRIIDNFVQNFGGSRNSAFMEVLWYDDAEIRPLIDRYWNQIDVMICGIGHAFTRYPGARDQAFPEDVVAAVRSKDLIGDYINYYFDINGNIYSMNQPRYTIPLETIQHVPQRMAIAGGYQKVESIIGALRTELIDVLVTDELTAQNILDYLK